MTLQVCHDADKRIAKTNTWLKIAYIQLFKIARHEDFKLLNKSPKDQTSEKFSFILMLQIWLKFVSRSVIVSQSLLKNKQENPLSKQARIDLSITSSETIMVIAN